MSSLSAADAIHAGSLSIWPLATPPSDLHPSSGMLSFKLLGSLATLIAALSFKETAAQSFCIHGINYNPRIGPDWAPVAERCKSAADIQTDMETLAQVTGSVRLYGLGDCDQGSTVVPAALNAGLTVSLGLWVSGESAVFESELAMLQTLIQQSSDIFSSENIVDIHVGSEAIYREEVTASENIADMNRVKTLLADNNLDSIPVTIADIGDVYMEHPELVDAVDFVQANAFPFWEKIEVEGAVSYFESRMELVYQQAAAAGKKVVIGETGWASSGSHVNASAASPSSAALYFSDFYKMAEEQKLEFYYFEAFDDEWKIESSNATVEGYFGLFHADRTLKSEIAALLLGSGCSAGSNEETVAILSNNSNSSGSSTSTSGATTYSTSETSTSVSTSTPTSTSDASTSVIGASVTSTSVASTNTTTSGTSTSSTTTTAGTSTSTNTATKSDECYVRRN